MSPLGEESQSNRPERLAGLRLAASFLTRLPLPPLRAMPAQGLAAAMGWFPVVGGLLGLGAGLIALLFADIVPPLPAAAIALALLVWATGALHEDGLADFADGMGGGQDKTRKLEIMRDSRIGTYGVLALGFSLLLRVGCLAALLPDGPAIGALIAAGAWSRASLPAGMSWFEPARTDGLGKNAGRPSESAVFGALGIGVLIVFLSLGFWAGVLALIVGAAASALVFRIADRQIGGFTGDVAGAAQQASEVAMLIVAVGMAA
jgi:adenosylcobinamide-GDP ribazoletransferase